MLHFLAAHVWISVSPRAPGREGAHISFVPTHHQGAWAGPAAPPHQLVLEPPFVYCEPLGGAVSPAETPSRAPKPFPWVPYSLSHPGSPLSGVLTEATCLYARVMKTKKTREGSSGVTSPPSGNGGSFVPPPHFKLRHVKLFLSKQFFALQNSKFFLFQILPKNPKNSKVS